IVVDGDDADPRLHKRLHGFATALPHNVEWLDAATGITKISELAQAANEGTANKEITTILFVLGTGRLRALRHVDDFSFSMNDDEEKPGKLFADLLENGPELNIHSFVWCESATVVNNTFQRACLRNFEKRLLFQMSSGDSSELIDDGAASRIGIHHAILCDLESLNREKFRPYVLTDGDEADSFIAQLT
ncbi:MAG: cell division protein FtsK, partial [Planctomycetes bacterium]|nr:cell division protein FtsK [Planctomycetota bacterium]